MKMKFWDRLILFCGALLTIAAGAFLAVGGLQFAGVLGEALPLGVRIACVAGGVLLVAFGAFLIALPWKLASRKHDFIVQQTDNGELRIAVKAIENLVQKCVDMHEEIKLDDMHIRNAREGVTVDLRISLANNISIPLAVASLQKQIKQYLVASSGIEVKEVRVSVETAGGNDAGDSPYLVPSSNNEQQSAPAPAAEKPAESAKAKVPLHQRIFGKPEQEATVPQPPKAEEEAPLCEPAADEAPEEVLPEEALNQAEEAVESAQETAQEAETELEEAQEDLRQIQEQEEEILADFPAVDAEELTEEAAEEPLENKEDAPNE